MPSFFWASWPSQTGFETMPLLDPQLSRQLGKYELIFEQLITFSTLSYFHTIMWLWFDLPETKVLTPSFCKEKIFKVVPCDLIISHHPNDLRVILINPMWSMPSRHFRDSRRVTLVPSRNNYV